jgi:integrase
LLKDLIRPKERKDIVRERKNLTDDQIIGVINYLNKPKHMVVAWIQKTTGIRAGDVFRIKRGDITYEEYHGEPVIRINVIGKRKKRNVVYIHHPVVQEFIVDYITSEVVNDDYYFLELPKWKLSGSGPNTEDSLMKQNYWWYWTDLKQALDLAGIDKKDWASHGFRYSAARVVWDLYKDIHILQNFLGHEDPKTTMRYLRQSGLQNVDLLKELQMGKDNGPE